MARKSLSSTKSGPGRLHADPTKSAPKGGWVYKAKRRNDKQGTTKLSRHLANQAGVEIHRKHPFSSTR